jgi:hypothetical protein
MKRTVLTWGDYGKITLPQIFGVNHWIVIVAMWILGILLFWVIEKKKL